MHVAAGAGSEFRDFPAWQNAAHAVAHQVVFMAQGPCDHAAVRQLRKAFFFNSARIFLSAIHIVAVVIFYLNINEP
jgi:hypothetical protein